jgi:hypothetical protein
MLGARIEQAPCLPVEECFSCQANAGQRTISPGPRILEGRFWNLEHGYPTGVLGWLVVVLKRHGRALHELSLAELHELGEMAGRAGSVLHAELDTELEYLALFAEGDHFRHVHVHVNLTSKDLAPDLRGPSIFTQLPLLNSSPIPARDVSDVCLRLQRRLASQMPCRVPE